MIDLRQASMRFIGNVRVTHDVITSIYNPQSMLQ